MEGALKSQHERVTRLVYEKYGINLDFPWHEFPDYEVFRHKDNRKWFGLIMNIPPGKLLAKDPSQKPRLPPETARQKEIYILEPKMPKRLFHCSMSKRHFPGISHE